jgi:hypothetical protein
MDPQHYATLRAAFDEVLTQLPVDATGPRKHLGPLLGALETLRQTLPCCPLCHENTQGIRAHMRDRHPRLTPHTPDAQGHFTLMQRIPHVLALIWLDDDVPAIVSIRQETLTLRGVRPHMQPLGYIYSVDFCAPPSHTLSIVDARGNLVTQHGASRRGSDPPVFFYGTGAPHTTHTLRIKDTRTQTAAPKRSAE